MRHRIFSRALGWAAGGLLGAASLLACAADTAPISRTPATNAPPSVATIELDVPVVEPIPPLQHGVSKTGRQHNSNCRYWKTVVAPVDPAKNPNRCKICDG